MNDHVFANELTDVEMFWVKSTSLAEFSQDISTLKAGKELAVNCRHSDSNKVHTPSRPRLCLWSHKVTIPDGIILGKPCGFGRRYVQASTA